MTLIARRDVGGLLFAFALRHPGDRKALESLAWRTLRMGYDEARRHMQLWTGWDRCIVVLERLSDAARAEGRELRVPGLRKLLSMAGISAKRAGKVRPPEPDLPRVPPLPKDQEALQRMVRALEASNRELRARMAVLQGELVHTKQQLRVWQHEAAGLRRQIRQLPNHERKRGP